jgi:hypothetical protein
LAVDCTSPALLRAAVRNLGLASLPAGVSVEFFLVPDGGAEVKVGAAVTTHALLPGQTEEVRVSVDATVADARAHFIARIAVESGAPAFRECRADNDSSAVVTGICVN